MLKQKSAIRILILNGFVGFFFFFFLRFYLIDCGGGEYVPWILCLGDVSLRSKLKFDHCIGFYIVVNCALRSNFKSVAHQLFVKIHE